MTSNPSESLEKLWSASDFKGIGVINSLNSLQPGVAFLYPPKNTRKPKGFLIFSGGIEKQHGAVMG